MRRLKGTTVAAFVFVVIAVALWGALFRFYPLLRRGVTVTAEPVRIEGAGAYPSNRFQYEASVWLGTADGRLFFYPHCGYTLHKSAYDDCLCVFQEGTARKIEALRQKDSLVIVGCSGQYLYYWDCGSADAEDELYCYDCLSERKTLLYTGNVELSASIWYEEDGSVWLPLWPENGKPEPFLHVSGAELLGVGQPEAGYELGDSRYRVACAYGDDVERIVRTDAAGAEESLELARAKHRSMVQTDYGLLIHCDRSPEMLYLLTPDGSTRLLFSLPCLSSNSCFAVMGDTVYLSVLRYEQYGEIGMKRFENDTKEGTYRISLRDGSVEKLSDQIYDGLYVFDGNGLYACDSDCSLYQLALDGTVRRTLFRVAD